MSARRRARDGTRHAATRFGRLLLACALGAGLALLVSCGTSGKGLIPTAQAGPLLSDFEAVQRAAETANGNCSATNTAIAETERDFAALPASVDAGLRSTLRQGIDNLRKKARELCAQPATRGTTTGAVQKTTSTQTTTTPPKTNKGATGAAPPAHESEEAETPGGAGGAGAGQNGAGASEAPAAGGGAGGGAGERAGGVGAGEAGAGSAEGSK